MIRVLVAAHSGSQGGGELCLDTTLRHLDRSKFEPAVCFAWDGPMAESARQMGLAVEILPLAWWMGFEWSAWHVKNLLVGCLPRIRHLVRRIRREHIDLVYTNTAVIFEAAVAARLAGVPHVWHVHEVLAPRHMRPRVLPLGSIVRQIGRLSQRVIFESNSAREVCLGRISADKAVTIYNSVRFDFAPLPPGEGRGEGGSEKDQGSTIRDKCLGDAGGGDCGVFQNGSSITDSTCPHPSPLPEGEGTMSNTLAPVPSPLAPVPSSLAPVPSSLILWLGRFSERKNPLMLLRAAARMRHRGRAAIVMAGEGPLEAEMRRTIDALGLANVCRILPFQDDVRPLLAAADILALTSQEESFGLVLAEAAAYGKPAVATRTQGPAEIVDDGRTGYLVPSDDEAALAARLDALVADPPLRAAMGAAAARRAAELFSPAENTRRIEALFEGVVALHRAAGKRRASPPATHDVPI